MQQYGFREGRLGAEGGVRLLGRHLVMWERNTRRTMLLLTLVAVALQGCVVFPVPTPKHGLISGRGEVTEADTVGFEVGKTTREEVLLRFGEPSATFQDERVFLYHWSTVRGYVVVAWMYDIGNPELSPIPQDYLLLLAFDDSGHLRRFERTSLGFFESGATHVDQWINGLP